MGISLPRAGELNRRIRIRLQTDSASLSNEITQSFSDSPGERWAKHEPVHGLANRAGAQFGEVVTDLFWVRWATGTKPEDMTAAHVIDCGGRRYRVMDAIDVNNARQFTRISAKDLGVISNGAG